MAKVYEVRLVGNCSELNGTIIRIPSLVSTTSVPGNGTSEKDAYDHQGAMQFIIVTVLVYSICGVLCTLINRIKRLRGKSNQAYMQDENVQSYLKSEKYLKLDGRRSKMQFDCEVISETLYRFEEKMKLRELGREIASGDFVQAHEVNDKKRKKNRKSKKGHDVGGALGQMGLSLFYIPDTDKKNNNIEDLGQVTSADEYAIALDNELEHVLDDEPEHVHEHESENVLDNETKHVTEHEMVHVHDTEKEHLIVKKTNDESDIKTNTTDDGQNSDVKTCLETVNDVQFY